MRRLQARIQRWCPPRHAQGGVLVMGSAMLLVLVLMGMLLWGISWRVQQRQRVQAALINGTRVVAQRWDYPAFAAGQSGLQPDTVLVAAAQQVLAANLGTVPGLLDTPDSVAASATWTIVRTGGQCGSTPVAVMSICGSVTARVQSLPLGLGDGQITVTTISTVDMP